MVWWDLCLHPLSFVFFSRPKAVITWQSSSSSSSNTFTLCPACQEPHCGLSARFCWAAGQSGPWSGKREAMNGASPGRTKPPPSYLTRPGQPARFTVWPGRCTWMINAGLLCFIHSHAFSFSLSLPVLSAGNSEECRRMTVFGGRVFGLGGKFSGNLDWNLKTEDRWKNCPFFFLQKLQLKFKTTFSEKGSNTTQLTPNRSNFQKKESHTPATLLGTTLTSLFC